MIRDMEFVSFFWSLIDKSGPPPDPTSGIKSRCWLWCGSITDNGYGRFKYDGVLYFVRRVAWEIKTGKEPDTRVISTRCLNKTCVRHLVALHRTELARAINEARGGRHYNARLNREQVHQILNLYKAGQYNQRQLADRYHVSKGAVSQIICGQSYRDI
jgi:hypothetical protein